jgi:hypothetical protein
MRILADLIVKTIEDEKDFVTQAPIVDAAHHNHRIGIIHGLRKCLDLMEEAESVLTGKERGN